MQATFNESHFPQADFWPGITSGCAVIQEQFAEETRSRIPSGPPPSRAD
jgi:hypothetical protein